MPLDGTKVRQVVLPFCPRPWQEPLIECNKPKIVAVVHRRAGKSTAFIWRALRKALTHDRSHIPAFQRNLKADAPRIVHVLPEQVSWKRTGLWDKVASAGGSIEGAVVMKSEMRVILPNGGVYQCGGMDKPDSWRGGYADEVIEDEADDVMAAGIDMVVEPMLADYSGSRVKIGTPKGNGRIAQAYNDCVDDPTTGRFLLPYQKTGVFTPEQIDRLRRDLTPEEFAQELECSFTAPNSGSYYGKWLDQAIADDRVTRVLYDPKLPVYTCWDLGVDDSTAIWWFQRSPGGEWRFLEYHEDNGQGLDAYAKLLHEKPYVYGRHYLPHDIEVRELTFGGQSRRLMLLGLGVKPIHVVPAANPADRVSAVRAILPRAWFDAKGCEEGLKKLRAYRRQWNEQMGIWRAEPVHDAASHCADSIGTGVQGSTDPEVEERRTIKPPPKTEYQYLGRGQVGAGWMR
jgi:phage terminase large subunit